MAVSLKSLCTSFLFCLEGGEGGWPKVGGGERVILNKAWSFFRLIFISIESTLEPKWNLLGKVDVNVGRPIQLTNLQASEGLFSDHRMNLFCKVPLIMLLRFKL